MMKTEITAITIVCLMGLVTISETALAEKKDKTDALPPGYAGLCFGQTLLLAQGKPADDLSVVSCNRALRVRTRDQNERSVVYHNRGVIEEAQGRLDAAYASFAKSVALSRKIDRRNVALAQLAFKHGDYSVALEQYELLLTGDAEGLSIEMLAIVARNKVRVLNSLEQTQLAQRKD
jgi:Tfp pilus assembly protein PilF